MGLFHPDPETDWLIPYFFMYEQDPQELLDFCAWREAYLARYGRIPPSEIQDMDPARCARLIKQVSELVLAEYKARAAANPLDPTTEDAAG